MNTNLKALFLNVFWPAAAGNVFWSFCALIIRPDRNHIDSDIAGRLAVLLLLALYLSVEWLRNVRHMPENMKLRFWIFDLLHVWAIVFCALAAYDRPDLLKGLLLFYFVITTAGHLTGTWRLADDEEHAHISLATINLVGVVVILAGSILNLANYLILPASFAIVLMLWCVVGRWAQIRNLFQPIQG